MKAFIKKHIWILVLFILPSSLDGQYRIRFQNDILEAALILAEEQGKKVFIDNYAPWCVPCKEMDKVFRDPKVADYFNEHFINVKINMDGRLGKRIHTEYAVVFLPTMLFLEPNGDVIYRKEQLISKSELLAIGKSVAQPEIYLKRAEPIKELVAIEPPAPENKSPNLPAIEQEPAIVQESKTQDNSELSQGNFPPVIPQKEESIFDEEKILFVLDSTGQNKNPDYLFNVAYLKLQLDALDKNSVAEEYLATQDDWSSEKNMNFIFDFLYTTQSPIFQYFIENKEQFEKLKGKEDVEETIDILVHMKLEQGYPRPEFDEALQLLTFIDPVYGKRKAYAYILDRFLEENKYDLYLSKAKEYIALVDPNDDEVLFQIAKISYKRTTDKIKVKESIKLIKKAVSINENNHRYFDLLAHLYYERGMKQKAMAAANKAILIAKQNGEAYKNSEGLMQMIKEL